MSADPGGQGQATGASPGSWPSQTLRMTDPDQHWSVEEILRRVSLEETLIIVTADHSHTLSVSGQLIFEGKSPLNILYQHFIYFKNMVNGIIVTLAGGYR